MAASTGDEVSHSNADDEEDGNSSDDGSEVNMILVLHLLRPYGENYSEDFISAGNILTNTIATPTNNQANPSDMENDSLVCARREEMSADGSVVNASVQTTSGNLRNLMNLGRDLLTGMDSNLWVTILTGICQLSLSRSDKTTLSIHCFYYYAVLDRVNLSLLSDVTPNTEVNADKVVINQGDVAQLQNDVIILISK